MVWRKHIFLSLAVLLLTIGNGWAETWDLDLNAGGSSLTGGIHYRSYMDTGYLRFGGSGVWADENSKEYQWGSADFMVGSDTMVPGLMCELGLRGLAGSAKDSNYSGDIGAIGFAANAYYLFSRDVLVIPLELYGGVVWSPNLLSFLDTETFTEVDLGIGIRVIKNASIRVGYTNFRVEMEGKPTSWVLKHDFVQLGLVLRF
ncbi:MAG: hypothetical protein M0036_01110 [Desulfobacteraceae bacterium]|nr:hypothetical protein [Desulfobacteraceae bacterium]